jgi:ABC-type Fe3+-hydroxamate transport system substrate-binding protein
MKMYLSSHYLLHIADDHHSPSIDLCKETSCDTPHSGFISVNRVCFVSAAAQDAVSCEAGFRLIKHFYGKTCIPEHPPACHRHRSGCDARTLRRARCSADQCPLSSGVSPYIRSGLSAEVIDHGMTDTHNLKIILAAKPGLIIGWSAFIIEDSYKLLSVIAPTIATPRVALTTGAKILFMSLTFSVFPTRQMKSSPRSINVLPV